MTTKNSLARNLHRLRTVVVFMKCIMANLVEDSKATLSAALASAYMDTLAKYHSMLVRGSCNAGFLLLPSRATFLASIGEDGAPAHLDTAPVDLAHLCMVVPRCKCRRIGAFKRNVHVALVALRACTVGSSAPLRGLWHAPGECTQPATPARS